MGMEGVAQILEGTNSMSYGECAPRKDIYGMRVWVQV